MKQTSSWTHCTDRRYLAHRIAGLLVHLARSRPRQMSASPTAKTRWHDYYQRDFKPWDSELISSQLRFFLSGCCTPDTLPASPGPLDFDSCKPTTVDSSIQYHICTRCAPFKPHTSSTALEIGCGTGSSCVAMAAAGFQVVGIDLVPAAVEAAQARAEQQGVHYMCRFICCDCYGLPHDFGFNTGQTGATSTAAAGTSKHQHSHSSDVIFNAASAAAPAAPSQAPTSAAPAAPAPAPASASAGAAAPPDSGFDFIYDCQTYHVLRAEDDAKAVQLYHRLLKPGGLIMLLTGNANEPYVGPNILTQQELLSSFVADGRFECVWVTESRFDTTQHYQHELRKRPLAWWALLRKTAGQR